MTPERKPSSPSPLRRIAAAALAVLLLTSACAPADAQLLGGNEEAIGAQEHPKILAQYGGAYADPRLQAYITGIGNRLAAQTDRPGPWTFTVLDSDVVNAFALPGGYVYVTRGLLALAEDEAEVASVLGHEIGHVIAHHGRAHDGLGLVNGRQPDPAAAVDEPDATPRQPVAQHMGGILVDIGDAAG